MSALNHEFDLSHATILPEREATMPRDPSDLAERWDALHEAAAAVCALAQLGGETPSEDHAAFPARARGLAADSYRMVADAVADLVAIMQPGLRALLALSTEGRDTTAAALTLWREFHMAREAIVSLVPAE